MTEHISEPIEAEDVSGRPRALSLDAPIYDVVQHSATIRDSATTAPETD